MMDTLTLTASYLPWQEPEPVTTSRWPEGRQAFAPAAANLTNQYDDAELDPDFAPHFARLRAIERDPKLWPEGSDRPNALAVSMARIALRRLLDDLLFPSRIAATTEGGVAISFRNGDKYADIECFNDGTILYAISNGRDRPVIWEIEQLAKDARSMASDLARANARIRGFLLHSTAEENVA